MYQVQGVIQNSGLFLCVQTSRFKSKWSWCKLSEHEAEWGHTSFTCLGALLRLVGSPRAIKLFMIFLHRLCHGTMWPSGALLLVKWHNIFVGWSARWELLITLAEQLETSFRVHWLIYTGGQLISQWRKC